MLGLEFSTLVARIIVLLTAFSFHEFAHAWMADQFGDTTPRYNGRLTLNPMAHLDPLGSLMLVVAGFGWAKPVPVNPNVLRQRSPAALMWVALAGPMSNLLLAILAAIPFRLGLITLEQAFISTGGLLPTLPQFLFQFIYINLILMLFNLIPLAPLDGEKIADYFFPPSWSDFLARIRPYGPMILMVLFIGGPYLGIDILGWIIGPALRFLFSALVG
ncbi:MAG: site-2 protease family protein [Anaerolineales bacterium]|nr:site-2 protease family protein [Chloroflexota bacterium]MBL6983870.1 site-2 protease family protein [Anaerolineales bacterium]